MLWQAWGTDILELRQSYVIENVDRLLDKLKDAGATRELLAEYLGHSLKHPLEDLNADEFEDLQEFLTNVEGEGKGLAVTQDGKLRGRWRDPAPRRK